MQKKILQKEVVHLEAPGLTLEFWKEEDGVWYFAAHGNLCDAGKEELEKFFMRHVTSREFY